MTDDYKNKQKQIKTTICIRKKKQIKDKATKYSETK